MKNNPHEQYMVDESSGIEVANQRWQDWEDGYEYGFGDGWGKGHHDGWKGRTLWCSLHNHIISRGLE